MSADDVPDNTIKSTVLVVSEKNHKAFKFRIYPTPIQEQYFNEIIEECRKAYNFLIDCDNFLASQSAKRYRFAKKYRNGLPYKHYKEIAVFDKETGLVEKTKEGKIKTRKLSSKENEPYKALTALKDCPETCADIDHALSAKFPETYEKLILLNQKEYKHSLSRVNAGLINQTVCDGYETAWKNFFDGKKSGRKVGKPKKKKRGLKKSFVLQQNPKLTQIDKNWAQVEIGLPGKRITERKAILADNKIWIRTHRKIEGKQKSITISKHGNFWFASILCEIEPDQVQHAYPGTATGLDRNCANMYALNDGTIVPDPKSQKNWMTEIARLDEIVKRRQKRWAKMEKKSKNWLKMKKNIAAVQARIARIRNENINEETNKIARKFETIVIEDLSVKSMMKSAAGTKENPGKNVSQKRGLNRAISQQAWSKFGERIKAKAKVYGGNTLAVSPSYTSQDCFACGARSKENRLTQDRFVCQTCGHKDNADVNAAKNILKRGLPHYVASTGTQSVAGCGGAQPSNEIKTIRGTVSAESPTVIGDNLRKGQTTLIDNLSGVASEEVVQKTPEVLATEKSGNNKEL